MTDTPETDAAMLLEREGITHPELHETYMAWTDYWALGQHARSLERRLHEAEKERDAAVQSNDAYEQSNAGLKRMVIATEKDALRYRWLRSKAKRSLMTSKKHAGEIQVIRWNSRTEADVLSLEELDTIIDAALAEKGKP